METTLWTRISLWENSPMWQSSRLSDQMALMFILSTSTSEKSLPLSIRNLKNSIMFSYSLLINGTILLKFSWDISTFKVLYQNNVSTILMSFNCCELILWSEELGQTEALTLASSRWRSKSGPCQRPIFDKFFGTPCQRQAGKICSIGIPSFIHLLRRRALQCDCWEVFKNFFC